MEVKKKYKELSEYFNLTNELPIIMNKIDSVKHQTQMELKKLTLMGLTMINPNDKLCDHHYFKKKATKFLHHYRHSIFQTPKLYSNTNRYLFSKSLEANKTQLLSNEKSNQKKKKYNPNTNKKILNFQIDNLPILQIEPKSFRSRNKISPYTKIEAKTLSSINNSPTVNLLHTIDSIENQCAIILTEYNMQTANSIETILKKKNEKEKKNEIDFLNGGKNPSKKRNRSIIQMQIKNRKLLAETEQINKLSINLAFKANKLMNVIFQNNTLTPYEEKRRNCKFHLNNANIQKIKIKQLEKAIEKNIKENKKAHKIYDNYHNQDN